MLAFIFKSLAYKLGIGKDNIFDIRMQATYEHIRGRQRSSNNTKAREAALEDAAADMGVKEHALLGQANALLDARADVEVWRRMRSLMRWRYAAFAAALAGAVFVPVVIDATLIEYASYAPAARMEGALELAYLYICSLAIVARFANFKKIATLCVAALAINWLATPHLSQQGAETLYVSEAVAAIFYLSISGIGVLLALMKHGQAVHIGLGQTDAVEALSKVEAGYLESARLMAPRAHRTRWNILFVALVALLPFAYLHGLAWITRPVACAVVKPWLDDKPALFAPARPGPKLCAPETLAPRQGGQAGQAGKA